MSHVDTLLVHAGEPEPRIAGSVTLPIFQSSTFEHDGGEPDGTGGEVRYIRYNNTPNHEALHAKLAALEGSDDACVTASGMAAIATGLMATLEAGDRVLAQPGLYGGTHTLLTDTLPRYDIEVDFLPEGGPEAWEEALQPSTQVLYVEALSNPLLGVADLERLAAFADAHDLVAMVDNTFATPINLRPMEWGFDLVVHSATKYLGGHSDLGAGVVAGRGALMEAVRPALRQFGGMLDPHACFLLHRSLKTLGLRVRQHNANALRLARALAAHDAVDRVYHPGLSAHPHHARAERLLDGFGGMLSLELVPGCDPDAFVDELTLAVQAPSLGGLETLITRPARTSHKDLPPEVRRERGITDRLLRVSVGLEDGRDLEDDFTQALDAVMAQAPA